MKIASKYVAAMCLAAGIAVAQAPAISAAPQAATTYCDVGQGSGTTGTPYGGMAHGPYGGRAHGKDTVYAKYDFKCNSNVTLVVHWNIQGPNVSDHFAADSPPQFLYQAGGCSASTPCTLEYTTGGNEVNGGVLDCKSSRSASGTASVYPANTFFPQGQAPLQTFQILTSTAVPCD